MNSASGLEVLRPIADNEKPDAAGITSYLGARADEAIQRIEQQQTAQVFGGPVLAPDVVIPVAGEGPRASFARIFTEHGVPAELVNLAKVESGWNRFAVSPKGARGIWQFMPDTARRYGLRVAPGIDERTDPEKSTYAAAAYLQDLHRVFGDWQLALAGYNAGERRVQSAQRKAGATDFSKLAGFLPKETQKYVPAVMSAARSFLVVRPKTIPVVFALTVPLVGKPERPKTSD